jgi:uncharacterized protein (TIGR03435 family)
MKLAGGLEIMKSSAVVVSVSLLLNIGLLRAQSPSGKSAAQASTATGHPLAFDVASVRANKSDAPPYANFPLGPGDVYVPNGGYFAATNQPLAVYILFAYKVKGNQAQALIPQLPGWVTSDRFDIQARAEGNPSKDEMREMMRSLLADRFRLAIRTEEREVPVLAAVLVKPGKTGPNLRMHRDDGSCPTNAPGPSAQPSAQTPAPSQTVDGGFPALCGGIFVMPPTAPGRLRAGARNVTMAFIVDSLSGATNLGRPMVDQTGLNGTVDFLLEFVPERQGPPPGPGGPIADPSADVPTGLTFQDALREQLGIKLESQKGSTEVLVVDHIEHASEN